MALKLTDLSELGNINVTNIGSGDSKITLKSTTGGDPTIIFNSAAANRSGVLNFHDNGTQSGQIVYNHNGDHMRFYTGGASSAGHLELALNESAGAIFRTQVQATNYFDKDDTAYYVNPAGTSVMNVITATGSITVNKTYPHIILNNPSSGSGITQLFSDAGTVKQVIGHINSTNSLQFYTNGTGTGTTISGGAVALSLNTTSANFLGYVNATTYYDKDNTNYYCDPGGQNRLNSLNLGSSPASGITGGYIAQIRGNMHMTNNAIDYVSQLHFYDDIRFYDNGNDQDLNLKFGDASVGHLRFLDGSGNYEGGIYNESGYFGTLASDGSWAVQSSTTLTNIHHYLNVNDSIRTPIYYDKDDTNYFTHPGDTSQMRAISIMQGSGLNLYQSGNASYAYQDARAEGSYSAVHKGTNNGSAYGPYKEKWYDGDSYHSIQISSNRWNFDAPITAATDMRAPLFYDTDNTSYYLDPANSSTSLATTGKWFMQGSHSAARIQLNYAHGSDATNSGTLTAWVSEPGITYENAGIGANIHVNGQYSGRAYDDGYGVYVRFDKGNGQIQHWSTTGTAGTAGGQGTQQWYNDASGNSFSTTSCRAPIFYDSNDTGYYTNPASTSNMNTIGAAVVNTAALTTTSTTTFNAATTFNPDGDSQLWIGNAGTDALAIYGGSGDTIYLGGNNTWQMYFTTNNYCYSRTWINLGSGAGIFSTTNSAHFYPNGNYAYGTWQINGTRNGYTGIYLHDAGVVTAMYDTGGNGGEYDTTNGWITYYHRSNDCLGVCASTTSSSYGLYVSKAIYSTADVVAYSDRRAKENIVTVDNALDKVSKLRGVYYNKKEGDDKSRKVGVIAQEVQEVLPEVVTYAKDVDEYGVDYGKINGLLIEAIKDLKKEVEELKKQLNK
jgi:hypothetical protein